MSAATVSPPGWPDDLPGPDTTEFPERVTGWLFDRGAPELRGHEVFRRHPHVLAWMVRTTTDAQVDATRRAYASARADLADRGVEPQTIAELLEALEFEGVRLVRQMREIDLVAQALAGRRWWPSL